MAKQQHCSVLVQAPSLHPLYALSVEEAQPRWLHMKEAMGRVTLIDVILPSQRWVIPVEEENQKPKIRD